MNNVIQQPRISTLTVEISVIKIGNNKMTLSVFDQLYESEPHDQFCNLIHSIWGKVNRSGADYVVFQKDNELRKWKIPRKEHTWGFESSIEQTISSKFISKGYFLTSASNTYDSLKKQKQHVHSIYTVSQFMNILSDDQRNEIIDEYNRHVCYTKLYNEMIDKLKESNQLFIAV